MFSPYFFLCFSCIFFSFLIGSHTFYRGLVFTSPGRTFPRARKEVADARKKKKAEVAQRKYKKEKEVAWRVKAGERKSDVESKLESEDPMDVDDMVFSDE